MNRRNTLVLLFLLLLLSALTAYGWAAGDAAGAPGKDASLDLTGSRQGQAVGFADVDGDGSDDKLVGAPFATLSSRMGAVLVYKGDAAGYGSQPAMILTGDENFGYTLANLGDVDGDGKGDFAVGAISGSGAEAAEASLSGTVSIYKGGSGGQLIRKLAGDGPLEKFGISLAAGDLNDDGYSDLIVGAPFHTPAPSLYQQGAVYVFMGPDFKKRTLLVAAKNSSGLGWAVAAGDMNGDGISDLLISASGKVLGFYGGSSFAPTLNSADVTIGSSAAGFGKAMAVVGDLDGDGKKEIALGAPQATVNKQRDRGRVFIVKGGTGRRTVNLDTTPAELLCRIDGGGLFHRFGAALSPVGDPDGDGKPGLAVGAPLADGDPNDLAGKVYFFRGKDIGPATTLAEGRSLKGMVKNQAYGTALAAGRKGQLLIGGPGSTGGTGGVALVDVSAGDAVAGGSSGGSEGAGDTCH